MEALDCRCSESSERRDIKKTQIRPPEVNTGVFGMTFTLGDINGRLDIQKNMQKKRSVNSKT